MHNFIYIVKLDGALGNQFFQYAHALAFKNKYGGRILFDIHTLKRQRRRCVLDDYFLDSDIRKRPTIIQQGLVLLFLFISRLIWKFHSIQNLRQYRAFSKIGLYYQYQIRWFDSFVKPVVPCNYMVGNWFSAKFFSDSEKEVFKALTYKYQLPEKCMQILTEIQNCESVCVHIRLGDYLSPQWKDKLYMCTPDYYHRAMALIKEKVNNPRFFVFSNRPKDFEIIKRDFDLGEVVYVNLMNNDVEDMELMRNCKHFIISNSTYSWWAQFLSNNEHKEVVAPSRFNNYPLWDMSDIYQEDWSIINV